MQCIRQTRKTHTKSAAKSQRTNSQCSSIHRLAHGTSEVQSAMRNYVCKIFCRSHFWRCFRFLCFLSLSLSVSVVVALCGSVLQKCPMRHRECVCMRCYIAPSLCHSFGKYPMRVLRSVMFKTRHCRCLMLMPALFFLITPQCAMCVSFQPIRFIHDHDSSTWRNPLRSRSAVLLFAHLLCRCVYLWRCALHFWYYILFIYLPVVLTPFLRSLITIHHNCFFSFISAWCVCFLCVRLFCSPSVWVYIALFGMSVALCKQTTQCGFFCR